MPYAYTTFDPSMKKGNVNKERKINRNTVFITLKKLFTLPANSFGIRENKYVTLKIRELAFVKPFRNATLMKMITAQVNELNKNIAPVAKVNKTTAFKTGILLNKV